MYIKVSQLRKRFGIHAEFSLEPDGSKFVLGSYNKVNGHYHCYMVGRVGISLFLHRSTLVYYEAKE